MAEREVLTGWIIAFDGENVTLDMRDGSTPSVVHISHAAQKVWDLKKGQKITAEITGPADSVNII